MSLPKRFPVASHYQTHLLICMMLQPLFLPFSQENPVFTLNSKLVDIENNKEIILYSLLLDRYPDHFTRTGAHTRSPQRCSAATQHKLALFPSSRNRSRQTTVNRKRRAESSVLLQLLLWGEKASCRVILSVCPYQERACAQLSPFGYSSWDLGISGKTATTITLPSPPSIPPPPRKQGRPESRKREPESVCESEPSSFEPNHLSKYLSPSEFAVFPYPTLRKVSEQRQCKMCYNSVQARLRLSAILLNNNNIALFHLRRECVLWIGDVSTGKKKSLLDGVQERAKSCRRAKARD